MNELTNLMKQSPDKIAKVRKVDNELGAFLNDITDYILHEDYTKATQATVYLFITLAKRASLKPYTLLRKVYKA